MPELLKIFGPPGTGKTTRLLSIMEQELERGVAPDRLAYLTFTVAARSEAKGRAMTRFGLTGKQLPWFRTLHSIAYQLLGVADGSLITGAQQLAPFAEAVGIAFSGAARVDGDTETFSTTTRGDRLMAFDHFRRHNRQTVEEAYRSWPEEIPLKEVQRFVDSYDRFKRDQGLLDFTDLLERGQAELPCDVVIVDEAQDLSRLQWEVFQRFSRPAARVYVAGDDDQAIYQWAGAAPEAFLELPGTIEVLPQSWRCPTSVSALAQRVIAPVHGRQAKEWRPRPDAPGKVSYVGAVDHVTVPDTGSVLVLYRNHYLADEVEQHLRGLGIPYGKGEKASAGGEHGPAITYWERLRKGQPVSLTQLEAALASLSLTRVPIAARDRVRKARPEEITTALLIEKFGWPASTFELPWFEALDRIDAASRGYFRALVKHGGAAALLAPARARLSTIHGAKGAEADHVVLLTELSRKVRKEIERNPDPERRVTYVGLTRAKETLTIVGLDHPFLRGA